MVVYSTWGYWIFLLVQYPEFQKNTTFRKLYLFLSSCEGVGRHLLSWVRFVAIESNSV
jgi:hypothetical protein